MSVSRIRTSDEPPDATWDIWGCNYVGFRGLRDYNGEVFPDQQCRDCTTINRTPDMLCDTNDSDSQGDAGLRNAEWLPEENSAKYDPLEYDSDADSAKESHAESECSTGAQEDNESIRNALCEMYCPSSNHHRHGTWCNGLLYTRDGLIMNLKDMLQRQACGPPELPLEHIAAPSCRSLQGINGHVLSMAEMKSCRNHRFLLAKSPDHQGTTDSIFEANGLFVLSGESNGSYASGAGRYVYPPRHGLDRVGVWTDFVNDGCNVRMNHHVLRYDGLNWLPGFR